MMLLELFEYLKLCVYEGARVKDQMRQDQVSRDLLGHIYLQLNQLENLKKLTCPSKQALQKWVNAGWANKVGLDLIKGGL